MRVGVIGLWHLGTVHAACLSAAGYHVVAYDPDSQTVTRLKSGDIPVYEPGLQDLCQRGLQAQTLCFTTSPKDLNSCAMVWVTFDTPVDNNDQADVESVMAAVRSLMPVLQTNAIIIVSSQLPVGSIKTLQIYAQQNHPEKMFDFVAMPENLRLGSAIHVFTHPDRIVVGVDNAKLKPQLTNFLKPFTDNIVWMSIASAEVTKHAINGFLALSVTFINELASLCEDVGANGREVEEGLKSDTRIGAKAYLRPGDAIAGGTLLRDIHYLKALGESQNRPTYLIKAIQQSNHAHKRWVQHKLLATLKNLKGKKIGLLGLTYKEGTDTLRRSTAIEICEWLRDQGTAITAYDPKISLLPEDYADFIDLKSSIIDAVKATDAILITTSWPEFKNLCVNDLLTHAENSLVLDPSGFIAGNLQGHSRIKYYSVGVPT